MGLSLPCRENLVHSKENPHAQDHHHGSGRPRLPQLQRRVPRRPGRRGGRASPPRRSRASTTASTRRRWPARATRTASRSGPRTSSTDLIHRARGRRGRARLLRPLARGRDAQGVDRARRRRDFRLLGPTHTMLHSTQAGRRGLRRADRLRQEPDEPPRRARSCSTPGCASRSCAIRCRTATSRRCASSASPRSTTSTPRIRRSRSARSTRRPCAMGMVMYAGVDYEAILRAGRGRRPTSSSGTAATTTSRSSRPTCMITVVDPLRPGHELRYHPGEINLRMADVVVVNKVDIAEPRRRSSEVLANVRAVNPRGHGRAAPQSPVTLDAGPDARRQARARRRRRPDAHPRRDAVRRRHGRRARQRGAARARRPAAVRGRLDRRDASRSTRTIDRCCRRWATATSSSPTSSATINATDCDVVVTGTPIDLGRLIRLDAPDPPRSATSCTSSGRRRWSDVLAPILGARAASVPWIANQVERRPSRCARSTPARPSCRRCR